MRFYEKWVINILKKGSIPKHIAFIMDGNRRHAKNQGVSKSKGHEKGFESLKKCLEWCLTAGVKIVTVFAFAIDNFKRDSQEVEFLMKLVKDKLLEIAQHNNFLQTNNIKVKVCGDLTLLKPKVRDSMMEVMNLTEKNNHLLLNICFAYDSIYEIDNAMKLFYESENDEKIVKEMEYDKMKEKFEKYLLINDKVDVIVRTSNEIRLSNFLIYQGTCAQLCFLKENWPEISIWSFLKIILNFQKDEEINNEYIKRLEKYDKKI